MLLVNIVSCLLLIYCLVIKIGHHTVSFNRYLALISSCLFFISLLDILDIYQFPLILRLSIIFLVFHAFICILILNSFSNSRKDLKDKIDLIFVFGAGLIQNRITLSLKKRLEKTIEIASKFPDAMIIVSGGQGRNEWLSEAEAMKKFLVENGIEETRVLLEDKSTSTQENLVYSMQLYDMKNKKVGLISNQFHVYRTEKMAKKLNLDGIAIPAYMNNIGTLAFYIREYLACIKAFLKQEI